MAGTELENRVNTDTPRLKLTVTDIICLKETQHFLFIITIAAINSTAMHRDKSSYSMAL